MLTKTIIFSFSIVIIITFIGCNHHISNEEFSFDKIYYYGIQEDVSKVVDALNSIPDDSLSADQKEIKEKYILRFQTKSEIFDFKTQDSLIINVLKIFHNYWRDILMKKESVRESQEENGMRLVNYLKSNFFSNETLFKKEINIENVIYYLSSILKKNGYYSRIDKTGNLMDLIIWTKQSTKNYTICLADTTVNIPVVFIDSTITLGWEGYATFDHFYPGGWTGTDTLYCIKKGYDINSENFKVSLLTHETQHLLDKKLYSDFPRWRAEYRAKLAELSVANKTVYDLINGFIKGSENDPRLPHPFAEYKIIENLSKEIFNEKSVTDINKWENISRLKINNASRKLLKQNSIGLYR
ncbi:MAG: hypothetical protein WCE54_02380 [Ignavibacteriaceae bacterium]